MSGEAAATTEVTLRTDDGVQLAARWYHGVSGDGSRAGYGDGHRGAVDPADVAVVVVHGFAARKDHAGVMAVAGRLVERGHPVLVYDGRGHGASGGACTLGVHERLDVAAAANEAGDRCDHVVVVGSSMGGIAVLAHLAALASLGGGSDVGSGPCGGVVVSTPARWRVPRTPRGAISVALTQTKAGRAVAARRLGITIAPGVTRIASPDQQIRMIDRPIAIIHGAVDRFIPASDARRLRAAARSPCTLNVVAQMAHGYCAAALDPIAQSVGWAVEQAGDPAASMLDPPGREPTASEEV